VGTTTQTRGAPSGTVRFAGARDLLAVNASTVFGDLVFDWGTPKDPADGDWVVVVPSCTGPDNAPPAPTIGEVGAILTLPGPVIHALPPGTRDWPGITGLATHLWTDAPDPVRVTAEVRTYTLTVTAEPFRYLWAFGDGRSATATTPGSREQPVSVTYLRRGDYTLRLSVVWSVHSHASDPDLALERDLAFEVTVTTTVRYHVAEIRSVLRARAASPSTGR
jgi:hypothetical protein